MSRHLSIKLCDPASYGCMNILAEPWQSDTNIEAAIAARIERMRGYELEPHEMEAVRAKIAEARKELE